LRDRERGREKGRETEPLPLGLIWTEGFEQCWVVWGKAESRAELFERGGVLFFWFGSLIKGEKKNGVGRGPN